MDGNYIKLYRNILDWEWYHNINTCRLFIHMLLKANWQDAKFEGKTIKRGSFVSSVGKLAAETDLTVREVRTAIDHLKSTSELTSKTFNKYTIFTIVNYSLYQASDKQNDKQSTSTRQTNDKLTTTIEEYKEEKRREEDIRVSDDTLCQTDVRQAIEMWNGLAEFGIKPVSKVSPNSTRYKMLCARLREYGLQAFAKAASQVKNSTFLRGENNRNWMITFDWFIRPNNFPKVLEGNYNGGNNIGTINGADTGTDKQDNEYSGRAAWERLYGPL